MSTSRDKEEFGLDQTKMYFAANAFIGKDGKRNYGRDFEQYMIDPENMEAGEEIETVIFREGKFRHWLYGNIEYTKEDLEKMAENHSKGIPHQQIAFNRHHEPKHGAYGWVEDGPGKFYVTKLSYNTPNGVESKNFLVAKWKPTEMGVEAIKRGEFKYISSEIHPDYTDNELVDLFNAEGEKVGEDVVNHGPAIIGVALTNTPFISKLPKMFSAMNQNTGVMRFDNIEVWKEPDQDNFGHVFSFQLKDCGTSQKEGSVVEDDAPDTKTQVEPEKFTRSSQEKKMNIEELLSDLEKQSFSSHNDEVDYLNDVLTEENLDTATRAFAKQLRKAALDRAALAKQLRQKEEAYAAQKEASELLEQQLTQARDEAAQQRRQSFSTRVELFAGKMEKDHGMPPVVVNKFTEVVSGLSSDEVQTQVFTNGDGGKVDLLQIMDQIFSAIPEQMKFTEGSELQQVEDPNEVEVEPVDPVEDDDPDYPEKVVKYANRNGLDPADVDEELYAKLNDAGFVDFAKLASKENG